MLITQVVFVALSTVLGLVLSIHLGPVNTEMSEALWIQAHLPGIGLGVLIGLVLAWTFGRFANKFGDPLFKE